MTKMLHEMSRSEMMRECLDNHKALIFAFVWQDTPEGVKFWDAQFETGLTDEGRAALVGMIKLAEAEEAARVAV